MSVFSVSTTVSVRYYARKRRADILAAIRDLSALAGVPEPARKYLDGCGREDLARIAFALHDKLPEESPDA